MAFHLVPAKEEEDLRSLSQAVIGCRTCVGLLVSKRNRGSQSSKKPPGFVYAFDKCALSQL